MEDPEEIEPAKNEPTSEESEAKQPDRPSSNASVARCSRAFNRAYRKKIDELGEGANDSEARLVGKTFYMRALPPLAGIGNIRDFIACITYAQLVELVSPKEAETLFACTKIALSALRRET
jgi:hypothetical protein